MSLELKTFRAPISIDAVDAPPGSVRALFSAFQKRDTVGDVVLPSFFVHGQPIPMSAWGHAWGSLPPGRGVIQVTDAGAVFEGQFFDTQTGQEHYRTVKAMADLQEWSFGFKVTEAYDGEFEGQPTRFLKAGETFEASPVLVGASRETRTLGIKGLGVDDAVLAQLVALIELHAPWNAGYISALPDSAFAMILPGGTHDESGRTTPRSLRLLPHHSATGAVDAAHLRNALARISQASMSDAQRATAQAHLDRHAKAAGVGQSGAASDEQAEQADAFVGQINALGATVSELKVGRAISADRMGQLGTHVTHLRQMADDLQALLDEATPPAKAAARAELLRFYAALPRL